MRDDFCTIRIGSSPATPTKRLAGVWKRVRDICPTMKIKIVPFENSPENAREILADLGKNIDVVGGIFDDTMLELRHCNGLELSREKFCCAVAPNHPLASKAMLAISDLEGETLLMMRRGWSRYVDELRDDLHQRCPQARIIDFDYYSIDIFNRCDASNEILIAVPLWAEVHPFLKLLPVDWEHSIPYGLLHSPEPSPTVECFLDAAKSIERELFDPYSRL